MWRRAAPPHGRPVGVTTPVSLGPWLLSGGPAHRGRTGRRASPWRRASARGPVARSRRRRAGPRPRGEDRTAGSCGVRSPTRATGPLPGTVRYGPPERERLREPVAGVHRHRRRQPREPRQRAAAPAAEPLLGRVRLPDARSEHEHVVGRRQHRLTEVRRQHASTAWDRPGMSHTF